MKRKVSILIFPLIIFFADLDAVHAASWKDFSSQTGNFSVLMPGQPVLQTSTQKSFVGSIGVNLYDLKTKNGEFSVEYSDLPGIAVDLGGHNTILDKAKKGFLKENGGDEQAFSETSLNGFPGKVLTYTVASSGVNGKVHFYLVQKRLYVIAGSQGPGGSQANIERFLNSFSLIDPPPAKK